MSRVLAPIWDMERMQARNVPDGQLLRRVGTEVVGYPVPGPQAPIIVGAETLILLPEHHDRIIELTDEMSAAQFSDALPPGWSAAFTGKFAFGYPQGLLRGTAPAMWSPAGIDSNDPLGLYTIPTRDGMASAYVRSNGDVQLVGDLEGWGYPDFPYSSTWPGAGGGGASSGSHVVTFPGPVTPGMLQVIAFRTGGTSVTHTLAGWTQIATRDSTGRTSVFARIAPATPGASATITLSAARAAAWAAVNVIAFLPDATFANVVSGEFTGAQSLDPPSHTPNGGARNRLWIAVASTRRTDNTLTAPTGMESTVVTGQSAASNTSNDHCRVSLAVTWGDAASFNPATFGSTGTTNNTHAATVGIRGPNIPGPL